MLNNDHHVQNNFEILDKMCIENLALPKLIDYTRIINCNSRGNVLRWSDIFFHRENKERYNLDIDV